MADLTWQIEYWTGALPLECVESSDVAWKSAPAEGVVFARIFTTRPDRPYKRYEMRLVGGDFYYLFERPATGECIFGQWTDPAQPYANPAHVGVEYTLRPDGEIDTRYLTAVPEIAPDLVKTGVLVPEPEAAALGLTGSEAPPRRPG